MRLRKFTQVARRPMTLAAAMAALVFASGATAGKGDAEEYRPYVQIVERSSDASGDTLAPMSINAAANAGVTIDGLYIVQFDAPPVASHKGGGIPVLASRGNRPDMQSTAARQYANLLQGQQNQFVAALNQRFGTSIRTLETYQYAFNGVALKLDAAQLEYVRKHPQVRLVEPFSVQKLNTDVGPQFIGAPAIWNGTATGGAPGTRGEGVVIGVLDSGVNWESPSFADIGGDGFNHTNPLGSGNYLGVCATETANADIGPNCNDKLIGAWAKSFDFVQQVNFECANPGNPGNELGLTPAICASLGVPLRDFDNALDENGHGSHTASTAGGNQVAVNYLGNALTVQGVANHANLISYDVCHTNINSQGSCFNFASLAAIEQVVEDGIVDVINFSIGGGASPWTEANSLAFLAAVDAGVFVAASAGNSGPAPATLGHREPWVSTTAASTHTRGPFAINFTASGLVVPTTPAVQNQPVFLGTVGGYHDDPLVNVPIDISPGINTTNDGCAAFPAGEFTGEVAVIRRGTCAFAIKVQNAANAGAIAVVIGNNQPGNIAPGGESNVTFAVFGATQVQANALRDYVNVDNGGVATISFTNGIFGPVPGDVMAGFSSRGPSPIDALKPDITGPGVNILAAYVGENPTTPTGASAPNGYDVISGTSMSSPHNAGSAALVRAVHPTWTVAEVKSAMMLTSSRTGIVKENGLTTADPFDRGAGRINLNVAAESGLVMDETPLKMFQADPAESGDPSALNIASIQSSNCVGECTFTRKVRSVASGPVTYTASFATTSGIAVTVTPAVFTINPGQTQTLTIEADIAGGTFNQFNFGDIVLTANIVAAGPPHVETVTPAVPVAIPDNQYLGGFGAPTMGCINLDTTGDVPGQILSANLRVAMSHTWIGDTTMKLRSPNGQTLGVFSRPGVAETADDGSETAGFGDSSEVLAAFPITFQDGAAASAESMGSVPPLTSTQVICRDGGSPCTYSPAPGTVAQPPSNFAGFAGGVAAGVWAMCMGDAAGGDTGSLTSATLTIQGGVAAAPTVHMPVALFAIDAVPEITVTPSSVTANGVEGGSVVTTNLAIGNVGFVDLIWNESPIAGTVPVWTQLVNGTDGIVTDFYIPEAAGAYSASDFTLGTATTLVEIFTPGLDDTGSLPLQPSVTWAIYPDAAGVPAGDPETNPAAAVWTYTANIGDPEIDITGEDITLDLVTAGENVSLPAGTYWLTVFPAYNNVFPNPRWFWSQAALVGAQTHLIDPQDLFGAGATAWTPLGTLGLPFTDTAFTLTGSVGSCGAPWLSILPTSGTVAPDDSQDVTVSLNPSALTAGVYNANLCLASNDPQSPITVVPVTFNVGPAPTNPTASGLATPAAAGVSETTLLTVNVVPGANPTSSGVTVVANLSSIGGSATQALLDNGLGDDDMAGDGTFTYNATVAAGTSAGATSFPVTVTDAQARTANASIAFEVLAATDPTATGLATPAAVGATEVTVLTVDVVPGTNPTSSGVTVVADLTSIGGSANQALLDNGLGDDDMAGDGTFTYNATVAAGTSAGATSFPVTVTDAQARTANASIAFEVLATTNPTGVGLADPASIALGGSTLLTVDTTGGTNPPSTGLSVTVDLSSIGGSAAQSFVDNGTGGDVASGDGTFSFTANVPLSATPGQKSLTATISDAQARTGTTAIDLTVTSPSAPSGVGLATPDAVLSGANSLLTVQVTSGDPVSTGLEVVVDLSAVGGSATQQMFDDGTNGDVTANNGTFSFNATVSGGPGNYDLSATISDDQARTSTAIIDLQILPPLEDEIFADGFEDPIIP